MTVLDHLSTFPRVHMGHLPTPLEPMTNLGRELGLDLWIKRDDCTGIGFGGNKVRQLEFYLGKALAQGATQILITGAVQSNFVRAAAAMAARLGMGCHIQLEDRVPDVGAQYRENGNVLLDQLLGATLHSFPEGEDEAGADAALGEIAEALRAKGEIPYIVPLSADQPPTGALGYVDAARELLEQDAEFDVVVVASGSALTHCGLLFGLRALGNGTPITGVCVRRDATAQKARVRRRLDDLAQLMGFANPVAEQDIQLDDRALAPGYGRLNDGVREAIRRTARTEGVFLDPVYAGKVMAALIAQADALKGQRVLFWHTGGQPALFGYADAL
ncbi:D-cysteine desulfhydrase family protein [uncultured Shimia sp.]|uniref:D-cysteine desulfhydrase family protein n=1 Tax=uncultured Shimia sp. TaxID=573152 RepID=UPI00261F256F|nr:D-cysteine desulfhydrase family protein [uncultured Shimia sp.]